MPSCTQYKHTQGSAFVDAIVYEAAQPHVCLNIPIVYHCFQTSACLNTIYKSRSETHSIKKAKQFESNIFVSDGQVRKIKHPWVYAVTSTWCVFAYVWLYIILGVTSPGVVEPWEAILTFLFFFAISASFSG